MEIRTVKVINHIKCQVWLFLANTQRQTHNQYVYVLMKLSGWFKIRYEAVYTLLKY